MDAFVSSTEIQKKDEEMIKQTIALGMAVLATIFSTALMAQEGQLYDELRNHNPGPPNG